MHGAAPWTMMRLLTVHYNFVSELASLTELGNAGGSIRPDSRAWRQGGRGADDTFPTKRFLSDAWIASQNTTRTVMHDLQEKLAQRDLDAYLKRIDYQGRRDPRRATLDALHLAHVSHIPFENLDILLGRPIRLDLPRLMAKLVWSARGGYCFEHNLLFAAVLEALGFTVQRLAARVRRNADRVRARTHMLLHVALDDGPCICDVGFGGHGLLTPLPLVEGRAFRQYAWTYRIKPEDDLKVLQLLQGRTWIDLYAFTLERCYPMDYEVANYYVSTHPASLFVKHLTVQRATPQARLFLSESDLLIDHGDRQERQAVAGPAARREALRHYFGLSFPSDTRFDLPRGDGALTR
jgi:N-hydroxyarylamine O-acetyltransferase